MEKDSSSLFGKTGSIITEKNIRDVFDVDVKIISEGDEKSVIKTVVPTWSSYE
jgi:ABC-type cobalamin/Fe3+-siderophores transport system ATPase subunit